MHTCSTRCLLISNLSWRERGIIALDNWKFGSGKVVTCKCNRRHGHLVLILGWLYVIFKNKLSTDHKVPVSLFRSVSCQSLLSVSQVRGQVHSDHRLRFFVGVKCLWSQSNYLLFTLKNQCLDDDTNILRHPTRQVSCVVRVRVPAGSTTECGEQTVFCVSCLHVSDSTWRTSTWIDLM